MDIKDPTILNINFSRIDKIPIIEYDFEFYKKLTYLNTHKEVEIETLTNQIISKSGTSESMELINNKQLNSDGFHYWINKLTGDIDFMFITEYKKGRITYSEHNSALAQVIYYYYQGLKEHQDNDKVKYLLVICESEIAVYNIENISNLNEICNLYKTYELNGYKFTGSSAYEKCTLVRDMVSIISPNMVFGWNGKGIADTLIYMRNNFELNK